jgi:hypothetical protein
MAEIQQALISHFSLLTDFFIVKEPVKDKDSRVLSLANLTPAGDLHKCPIQNF